MKVLSEIDYADAAQLIGCDVAAIKAVAEVESGGAGFLPDGRCKILYEPHIFCRYTNARFSRSYPTLSYPKWKPGSYGPLGAQWPKFLLASKLDPTAAIYACSWGKFQIMGFNYVKCGYANVADFRAAMEASERDHLLAFCGFIQSRGLTDELQRRDWSAFASGYNGAGFAANRYDQKIAAAYKKYAA